MKDYSIDKCFNIYYLNLSKVYEISMMINNTIVTSIQREKNNSFKTSKSTKASLGGTIQTDSEYLASIKSVIESNKASENTSSSKIIESLDIKTTKSILLNKIKAKCINDKKINDLNEGDLIKIDNIQLSIFDKDTLRQILLLKRDALKGMKVEGLDINNIVNSIIKDYSYILIGQIENDNKNKIIIKIPFEIENEFENNYNVDDLLLGKISLIGIYKNKNKISDITNNTLNYYQPPCTESTGFDVRTGTPSMLKHTIVIIYKYIFYSILLIFNIFFYSLSSYLPYTPTKISCRPHMLSPKLLP